MFAIFKALTSHRQGQRMLAAMTAVFLLASLLTAVFAWRIIGRRWRQTTLVLATSSRGSSYHRFAQALERVANQHAERSGLDWRLDVITTDGSRQNMRLLQGGPEAAQELRQVLDRNGLRDRNRVHLILAQSDTPTFSQCRLIAPLFPEVFHLVASEEITGVEDLRGKRVAVLSRGSRTYELMIGLLKHFQLTYEGPNPDVELVALAARDMVRAFHPPAFLHGEEQLSSQEATELPQVDAFFYVVGTGNQLITTALRRPGSHLVPIDEAAALGLWFPKVEPHLIPKGAYGRYTDMVDGRRRIRLVPAQDTPSAAVRAMLAAHEDVPFPYIAELTEIIYEFDGELSLTNPTDAQLQEVSQVFHVPIQSDDPAVDTARSWFEAPHAAMVPGATADLDLGIPLHKGTRQYLTRYEPTWLERNADVISLVLAVAAAMFTGTRASFSYLWQQKQARAAEYNASLLAVVTKARQTHDRQELECLWQELTRIFAAIVNDLEKQRVSSESFGAFRFTWDVAKDVLCHRELLLAELANGRDASALRRIAQS